MIYDKKFKFQGFCIDLNIFSQRYYNLFLKICTLNNCTDLSYAIYSSICELSYTIYIYLMYIEMRISK